MTDRSLAPEAPAAGPMAARSLIEALILDLEAGCEPGDSRPRAASSSWLRGLLDALRHLLTLVPAPAQAHPPDLDARLAEHVRCLGPASSGDDEGVITLTTPYVRELVADLRAVAPLLARLQVVEGERDAARAEVDSLTDIVMVRGEDIWHYRARAEAAERTLAEGRADHELTASGLRSSYAHHGERDQREAELREAAGQALEMVTWAHPEMAASEHVMRLAALLTREPTSED